MTLRALIWDIDGTLAETEDQGHRIAFNRVFAEAGLGWHWDPALYAELLAITGGKERLLAWWQRVDPQAAAAPQAEARVREWHRRKTEHYVEMARSGAIELRPGVRRLLAEAAARGLRQAIATTTSPENVAALFEATLAGPAAAPFEVIGAGDIVAAKKPAPDIYRWVLERLQLPAGECLAIEDSQVGVQSARAAGIPVLLTRSRYTSGEIEGCVADLDGLDAVRIDDLVRWQAQAGESA
jgi:HAD superfamily hydrolase (TIGR01509 family)